MVDYMQECVGYVLLRDMLLCRKVADTTAVLIYSCGCLAKYDVSE